MVNKLKSQYAQPPVTDDENIHRIITQGVKGKQEQFRLVDAAKTLFGWLRPESKKREDLAGVASNIKIPAIWSDTRFPKNRLNDNQKAAAQRLAGYLVLHPEQTVYKTRDFPVELKLIIQETGLQDDVAFKIARVYIEVLQERIDKGEKLI
jgi:hypothetical protein